MNNKENKFYEFMKGKAESRWIEFSKKAKKFISEETRDIVKDLYKCAYMQGFSDCCSDVAKTVDFIPKNERGRVTRWYNK